MHISSIKPNGKEQDSSKHSSHIWGSIEVPHCSATCLSQALQHQPQQPTTSTNPQSRPADSVISEVTPSRQPDLTALPVHSTLQQHVQHLQHPQSLAGHDSTTNSHCQVHTTNTTTQQQTHATQ